MRVLLLNGPNLNLLGTRNPEVYGDTTLADLETLFRGWAADLGVSHVEAYQSNHEGHLIDRIHAARGTVDAIVFNPGAYTHTSYALHDAIEAVEVPTVETHISNVEEREAWRRHSCIRPACVHTVYGRGIEGYRWALTHLVTRAAHPVQRLACGPHPDQHADLRLPEGEGPFPLAVTVHGGFWRHQWTRDTIERAALDLTRRGVASLNVEYRRVGTGGGREDSVLDVVAAITAGLQHPQVDADRWVVAGHSAGAQLALAAVARMKVNPFGPVAPPRLAASLGGVLDLRRAMAENLGDGAVRAYLDGADADPLSPIRLRPLGTRILVAHGREDDEVGVSQAEGFVEANRSMDVTPDEVELLVHGGGHYDYLDPADPAWIAVAERLVSGLQQP